MSTKLFDSRPFVEPEASAKKLMEIANGVEPVQDGRIFIELINGPFLFECKGSPAEYGAGLRLAIGLGWLWLHESGTYVKLTQSNSWTPVLLWHVAAFPAAADAMRLI
jgi:hypothetical protein